MTLMPKEYYAEERKINIENIFLLLFTMVQFHWQQEN